MLFSSYGFLFLFLPIAIGLFYLTKKIAGEEISKVYIIMISLIFYGIYYPVFLLFLMVSIFFNTLMAVLIKKISNLSSLLMVIGILMNIIALIFYQYSEILSDNLSEYAPSNLVALQLLYPLGMGFLTFIQSSYLISAYKKGSEFNLDYCLRCAFFPSLVIGPLYKYENGLEREEMEGDTTAFDFVAYGIYILIIGLFKVVVLGNSLYIYVFNGMNISNLGLLTAWLTVLAHTFWIYFSFSGYCDIAIGIGKMFRLNIGHNFISPYKSLSLSEFSKRWHTSFAGILKELIYTPVTSKYQNRLLEFVGIVLASIVGSFWFGISFHVLLAGLIFGLLLFTESLLLKTITKIPGIIRWAITFLIINLLLILLGVNNLSQAINIYKGLFNFKQFGLSQISDLAAEGSLYFPDFVNVGYFLIIIILSAVICLFCKNTKDIMKEARLTVLLAIGLGLLFLIIVIHISRLEFLF